MAAPPLYNPLLGPPPKVTPEDYAAKPVEVKAPAAPKRAQDILSELPNPGTYEYLHQEVKGASRSWLSSTVFVNVLDAVASCSSVNCVILSFSGMMAQNYAIDGAKVMVTKPVSNNFQVQHNISMGAKNNRYNFGVTYVGESKYGSPEVCSLRWLSARLLCNMMIHD